MSHHYGFFEYVTVAEKQARNRKAIEKLRKKNPHIAPVVISGKRLAATWWGKAWGDNLESYSDYANRMGRGRSYVRHGAILDLQITPAKITALVQGSENKPYEINIAIKPLNKDAWKKIAEACEGKIESLQELMEGGFPKALNELFTAKGKGLFPAPGEITLQCSCPDYATMCKHVAATLYGVGARLDEDPGLFFVLRDVNMDDLVSKAIAQKSETLLKKSGRRSSRIIDSDDILGMFGIEMEVEKPEMKEGIAKKKVAGKRGRKPKDNT